MIATLPMYDWPELRSDTDAYWQILRDSFLQFGFDPPAERKLVEDETEGWLEPDLFFSQTCGYPFVTRLEGRVALLGTPHFDIDGWQGPNYSSAVIVRNKDAAENLEEVRSAAARFAFNSSNSLSGYRCMSPLVGKHENWFGELIKSGGHRFSANMVAEGDADIAAIDALCWHLYRKFEPVRASRIRVLCWTPPLPGLPYITNTGWSDADLQRMKQALSNAITLMKSSGCNQTLRLAGVSHLSAEKYGPIRSL